MGVRIIAICLAVLVVFGGIGGCAYVAPSYNVYSQRMAGEAKLAEAQSSRQVATLEARAKMESSKSLADAEVIRATGAARANAILQNSLGGPEGYLEYLKIQALSENQHLVYVPTEANLPITEAGRR